jgi:hypothetical protein
MIAPDHASTRLLSLSKVLLDVSKIGFHIASLVVSDLEVTTFPLCRRSHQMREEPVDDSEQPITSLDEVPQVFKRSAYSFLRSVDAGMRGPPVTVNDDVTVVYETI